MPESPIDRAHEWLGNHESELLDATVEMLKIPSIEGEPEPGAPFGIENRRALDLALSMAKSWGFTTKDIDGYAGYAEFGEGERLVMTLGHLDVVPIGPGWKHDPFGAEIEDGYIYARGATDDKGPTMASFFAVRSLMEACPEIGKSSRVRIVFGCNEESGFGCIHRYTETEEAPTYGIAPDSGWPLIHAEKGIANLFVSVPLNVGTFRLLTMEGGQRPNIVIDRCSAVVEVDNDPETRKHVESKLADAWDKNVTFEWQGIELHISAVGKACHGAMPFGGDSAATRILRFLHEVSPLESQNWFEEVLNTTQISGAGLGIHGSDQVSRDLTNNLGVVHTEGGRLYLLFNVRYPVTWKGEDLKLWCEGYLSGLKSGFRLDKFTDSPSLYFPLDHPLVKTICEVYKAESGQDIPPGVMGGGTYARAIANTVSVGTSWEGDGLAHENDERYKVEHLFRASRIYASILYRLATL